nr:MAG TPA: hypothetical protein [Caudoviricetes sp.]
MNAPCKGCTFREVGCHVRCPMYRMYQRKKKEEKRYLQGNVEVSEYVRNNVQRIRRRIGKSTYACTVND